MKALPENLRKALNNMSMTIDRVIQAIASGRLRRRSVRLRVRGVKPATGLARYCARENRRACEEALRLVGLFFSSASIEEAIRWGLNHGVQAEVVIAYFYAFVLGLTSNNFSQEVLGSLVKVRVDFMNLAIDLTPVGSVFTVTDARNLLPSLRLRGF